MIGRCITSRLSRPCTLSVPSASDHAPIATPTTKPTTATMVLMLITPPQSAIRPAHAPIAPRSPAANVPRATGMLIICNKWRVGPGGGCNVPHSVATGKWVNTCRRAIDFPTASAIAFFGSKADHEILTQPFAGSVLLANRGVCGPTRQSVSPIPTADTPRVRRAAPIPSRPHPAGIFFVRCDGADRARLYDCLTISGHHQLPSFVVSNCSLADNPSGGAFSLRQL
jgi:hypothetical protein